MNEPLRALIVDDEPPARQVLLRLLRDSPEVVVAGTASNGLEALDVLARETIDLLFLDIEMPALAGLELATRLQPAASPQSWCSSPHGRSTPLPRSMWTPLITC